MGIYLPFLYGPKESGIASIRYLVVLMGKWMSEKMMTSFPVLQFP